MRQVKNENVTPFDIDGTLVVHLDASALSLWKHETIKIYDEIEDKVTIYGVNSPMVRLLKEEKSKGSYVIAWSRGGNQWAWNVITTLQLESYVDLVLTKPLAYFDDKKVDEWLIYRVFLEPDTVYKAN